jgi:hypothetical protein
MCECGKKTCIDCDGSPESKQKRPHKHAELIKAWADGAVIQGLSLAGEWLNCPPNNPSWSTSCDYRIKPVPKPDVVLYAYLETVLLRPVLENIKLCHSFNRNLVGTDSLKVVYDGETGKLKSVSLL